MIKIKFDTVSGEGKEIGSESFFIHQFVSWRPWPTKKTEAKMMALYVTDRRRILLKMDVPSFEKLLKEKIDESRKNNLQSIGSN